MLTTIFFCLGPYSTVIKNYFYLCTQGITHGGIRGPYGLPRWNLGLPHASQILSGYIISVAYCYRFCNGHLIKVHWIFILPHGNNYIKKIPKIIENFDSGRGRRYVGKSARNIYAELIHVYEGTDWFERNSTLFCKQHCLLSCQIGVLSFVLYFTSHYSSGILSKVCARISVYFSFCSSSLLQLSFVLKESSS